MVLWLQKSFEKIYPPCDMAPTKKWPPTNSDSDSAARAHIHGCLVHLKECLYPSYSSIFCTNISDHMNWKAFLLFSCFQIIWCYLLGKFLERATNCQLLVYSNIYAVMCWKPICFELVVAIMVPEVVWASVLMSSSLQGVCLSFLNFSRV